ncbi:MAG: DedA family protein [Kofleriaceae bacterium]
MLDHITQFIQDQLASGGYPVLFLLITLESTLVPIPSEIVMPFAGVIAAKGLGMTLPVILIINSLAAMLGSGISYWIGAKGGKPLVLRYGKYFLIRQKDIELTERYFANHGKATILISRFLPVIRHIISLPAGVARMPLVPFFTQTFIGSTIWGSVLMILGYHFGEAFLETAKKVKHVDLIVGVVILAVLLALAIRFVVRRRRERALETASGTEAT